MQALLDVGKRMIVSRNVDTQEDACGIRVQLALSQTEYILAKIINHLLTVNTEAWKEQPPDSQEASKSVTCQRASL